MTEQLTLSLSKKTEPKDSFTGHRKKEEQEEKIIKRYEKNFLGVIDMFIILTAVMVS